MRVSQFLNWWARPLRENSSPRRVLCSSGIRRIAQAAPSFLLPGSREDAERVHALEREVNDLLLARGPEVHSTLHTTKRCGRCKEDLPLDSFHRSIAHGFQAYCKSCHAEYNMQRRASQQKVKDSSPSPLSSFGPALDTEPCR
eukprot:4550866-Amphidinium_carterae.1